MLLFIMLKFQSIAMSNITYNKQILTYKRQKYKRVTLSYMSHRMLVCDGVSINHGFGKSTHLYGMRIVSWSAKITLVIWRLRASPGTKIYRSSKNKNRIQTLQFYCTLSSVKGKKEKTTFWKILDTFTLYDTVHSRFW